MLTSKFVKPGIGALTALGLGLLSQTAAATEEIVVNGTDEAAMARASASLFQAEIEAYMRDLNRELKAALDQDLQRLETPKLRLAASRTPSRG